MTIDELKQDWHKKMTALRDERDWLNQHVSEAATAVARGVGE